MPSHSNDNDFDVHENTLQESEVFFTSAAIYTVKTYPFLFIPCLLLKLFKAACR